MAVSTLEAYSDSQLLFSLYGVSVDGSPKNSTDVESLTFQGLEPHELKEATLEVLKTVGMFPTPLVSYLGTSTIRAVKDLTMPHPLRPEERISVGGITTKDGKIYVVNNSVYRFKTRQTLMHEMEHRWMYQDIAFDHDFEDEWLALDPTMEDRYLRDFYWELSDEQKQGLDTSGFVSPYALVDPWEDMAETVKRMIDVPNLLYSEAQGDPLLIAKINFMKGVFRRRTHGKMADRYFNDLTLGNVALGYWDTIPLSFYRNHPEEIIIGMARKFSRALESAAII